MAFDINKFNAMMNEILPYIMQDEMRKRQLREQIQGWTEYDIGKSRREMESQRALNKMYADRMAREYYLQNLLGVAKEEAIDQPAPSDFFASTASRYFPELDVRGLPENYPEMQKDLYDKIQQLIIAQRAQDPEKATDEAILGMMKGRGIPETVALMDEILKGRTGIKERELEEAKLEEMAKTRGLREAELEEYKKSRETAGTKTTKGGADQKDAIKQLEKLYKDRYSIIEDLMTGDIIGKERKGKESLVISLNRQISDLKKSTGLYTEEDKIYQEGATWLKNNGFTKQDLLTNWDLINKLQGQGIIPLIMLEYF